MKQFTERSPLLSPQRKITAAQEEAWLEDAVTIGLRRLCAAWSFSISMWYLSFVVKESEIIFKPFALASNITRISVVFIPMWLGSIGGILMIAVGTRALCGCHKNLRVISKEHHAYLHHTGSDTRGLIAFESLPLLRLYYFWSILSILAMLCLVVTQVLWYLWLVEGVIGVWHACIPVGVLCLGGVLYVTLWKSVSLPTAVCILLAVSWLILITIKLQEDPTSTIPASISGNQAHHLSWSTVLTPLILLQAGVFLKLGTLAGGYCIGTVRVAHRLQWAIWWVYICALVFSIQYVWLALKMPLEYDSFPTSTSITIMRVHPLASCWFLTVTLLVLGILTTCHVECQQLTRSKGFVEPIPLEKNAIGTYQPTPRFPHQEFSVIGTIIHNRVCPPHLSYVGVQQQLIPQGGGTVRIGGSGNEPSDSSMVYGV